MPTQQVADRVKETATTTGTGNITLAGAAAQFQSFNTAIGVGPRFKYSIVGQIGSEWETGEGYLSASTTLVRDIVESSSNANALVTFSAGTKDVFIPITAKMMTTRGQREAIYAMSN